MKQLLTTACCLLAWPLLAQTHTISGYIRDAETGENLIGATILDISSRKGTVTNTFGFYSLTLPAGKVTLRVTYVGYQPVEELLDLTSTQTRHFDLTPGSTLEEVVVTADEKIELSPQMSSIDVPIEQIKALPVLMGESDILKSLQLLPGIQGGTEGSSGIYVRGGGPDQNLILLDGVPVYNVSHLFGFFSVFNADAINRVNVVKGGFPARYGGRLSSVIDITMKEGNNQKFAGEGSVGLISSKLTLEGPIGKNQKTSFLLSGRRTYIDLLTRPLIRLATEGEGTGGYYFYDFNGKINHRISDKDRIYLSFYNGLDKGFAGGRYRYTESNGTEYDDRDRFGLGWGNTIAALRWNHVFGPRLFGNLTGTYSKYKFRVFAEYEYITREPGQPERTDAESIEYFSGIDDVGLKLDMDYILSPQHNIKTGINSLLHQFTPGILGYETNEQGADTTLGGERTIAWEYSAYAEDDIQVGGRGRANAGLHYSGFLVNGRYYHSLQPRLAYRQLLPNDIALKASYARMTQYIHLLTNGGIGLPTDLWVPATKNIAPQQSWQVAVGAAKTYKGYEFSAEVYYKEMSNLIDYKEGATYFHLGADWQTKVTTGTGESYGGEFLIQKKTGKLSGWVGYTLSWTNRHFESLNFGKPFPYKYDRRHDVSVVGVYQVNERFSMSGTWVYGTGAAITLPVGQYERLRSNDYHYYGSDIYQYSDRNGFRMRDYHRMDLGFTWTKPKKGGLRSWSTGAYNVYNRRNPFFLDRSNVIDDNGNASTKFVQYSLFPIIPYVKYDFKF